MTDSKQTGFFEIKDQSMVAKLLGLLKTHKIPITLWLRNQTFRFETTSAMYHQHLKKWTLLIAEDFEIAKFEGALAEQGSREILGSFQIDRVNFFFKTLCQNIDDNQLPIEIPPSVFKLQRRANLRIPLNRSMAPKVSFFKPGTTKEIMEFRMLDVSAGGVAIAASTDHDYIFKNGTKILDIRFNLRGTSISCDGVVRHCAEIVSDKLKPILKVGIEFTRLKPGHERIIAKFVLDESRRIFTLLG